MASNSFGELFRITTFGESHGKAVGCIVDGCPSLIDIREKDIQKELDRRKPGQSDITTSRNEEDKVEILSGVFDGKTTAEPITTTGKTCKIKFKMPSEGIIYAKWWPADASIESTNWEATLDLTQCGTYKRTAE